MPVFLFLYPLKIGVIGCGAVGIFYGARLCRSGEDVHFLLRSDFEIVRQRGVHVQSPEGDFHASPKCTSDPVQIGACDLVIVSLKTTANAEFPRLLSPLVGSNTALLTLQNGLGNEEELASIFGANKVLGGLCFVCLNRTAPGIVQHMAHGHIHLGEFKRAPSPRTHTIANLFRNAGIPVSLVDRLDVAHWEKLVWNIPFNGLSVASSVGWQGLESGTWDGVTRLKCLSTDQLLDDKRWFATVRALMREVILIANSLDLKLDDGLIEDHLLKTRNMGNYRPSTLVDFEMGREIERVLLFQRPLDHARRHGIPTPWLERLCKVLDQLTQPLCIQNKTMIRSDG